MLRITASTSAAGAKKYFGEGLSRADYYIDGQEVTGQWLGKGAERLGLSGEVDRESYFALCDNRHPETGEKLTVRDKDNRRVGYDFTFSAPKSVSVLYELTGDHRILDAFQESARETMAEAETEMKTRVRVKGANEDRITGEMVTAEFVHFTSRPVNGVPDPHLHAHMYSFNATWDGTESRWKAGEFGGLKRDATYFEAAFDARLADRLNRIGIATEKAAYSFRVAGLPQSVTDKFSSRRNQIEATAKEKGITSAKGKHEITRRGREKKTANQSMAELRAEWRARLTPEERKAFADVKAGRVEPSPRMTPGQAMDFAVEHSFVRESTTSEKRLKATALQHGVGSVLPDQIQASMKRRGDLIPVTRDGQAMVTTRGTLDQEIEMLAFARDGRGRFRPMGDVRHLPNWLTVEQGAAAAHVLQSRDFITGIRGGAGTGKTTTITAVIGAIEKTGKKVHGFAPTSSAARGTLREVGLENAETLATLLNSPKAQARVKGGVILVDEAGMVSSRDMLQLEKVAEEQKARIMLVGDDRQFGSVDAGEPFRLLESEAGVRYGRLTEIRRQHEGVYRDAVKAISSGKPKEIQRGFDMLDRAGMVVEVSGEERHKMLVSDYLDSVSQTKRVDGKNVAKTALVLSPTIAEGAAITHDLRAALKERGTLGQRDKAVTVRVSTQWTAPQKGDARNYERGMVIEFTQNATGGFVRGEQGVVSGMKGGRVEVVRQNGARGFLPAQGDRFEVFRTHEIGIAKGDRIRITKNDRNLKVSNGDIFTVEGFTKPTLDEPVKLRLSGGITIPATHGHLAYGYVDTSRKGQSKTVDRVHDGIGSVLAVDSKQFYVDASRGREWLRLYVENKGEIRDAIAKSGQRMAAVELVKGTQWERPEAAKRDAHDASRRVRLNEALERSRLYRYVRDRAETVRDGWRNKVERIRGPRGRLHA